MKWEMCTVYFRTLTVIHSLLLLLACFSFVFVAYIARLEYLQEWSVKAPLQLFLVTFLKYHYYCTCLTVREERFLYLLSYLLCICP